jgi:hypothetical protein
MLVDFGVIHALAGVFDVPMLITGCKRHHQQKEKEIHKSNLTHSSPKPLSMCGLRDAAQLLPDSCVQFVIGRE